MGLQLITDASAEPVTLAEAKLHAKVEESADDALVTAIITAARQWAEQKTGRALLGQTWRLSVDRFPDALKLIKTPVLAVSHVKYIDVAGVQQTLDPTDYALDATMEPAWIVPAYAKAWPDTREQINAVEAQWIAGYHADDRSKVPAAIKQWILIAVATMYELRESVVTGTIVSRLEFVDRLLDRYTVQRL